MKIVVKCPVCIVCRQQTRVMVEEDDFYKWQGGMLIQDAFPYLTPTQRELMVSGTHQLCWNKFIYAVEEYANGDGQRV